MSPAAGLNNKQRSCLKGLRFLPFETAPFSYTFTSNAHLVNVRFSHNVTPAGNSGDFSLPAT